MLLLFQGIFYLQVITNLCSCAYLRIQVKSHEINKEHVVKKRQAGSDNSEDRIIFEDEEEFQNPQARFNNDNRRNFGENFGWRNPEWSNNFIQSSENFNNDFARPNFQNTNTFKRRPQFPQRPESTTVAIPGMGTSPSPCEVACLTTSEYNPVCGDNNITYFNLGRFRCAQRCGKNVNIQSLKRCFV